jgi:hypothetical protein
MWILSIDVGLVPQKRSNTQEVDLVDQAIPVFEFD